MLSLKVVVKVVTDFRSLRKKADQAKERTLKRSGALVRKIMRSSIKYRAKGSAPAGSPPYSHTKSGGIKNLILFQYDPKTQSVVIGPARDPQAADNVAPVPGTLEQGGRSRIRLPKAIRRAVGKPTMIVRVQARPFAKPALDQFEKSYPDLWKGAVQ
jgi:hypothetical protein